MASSTIPILSSIKSPPTPAHSKSRVPIPGLLIAFLGVLLASILFITRIQAIHAARLKYDIFYPRRSSSPISTVSLTHQHACHGTHRQNLRFCLLRALLSGDQHAAKKLVASPGGAYLSTCTPARNAGDLLPEFIVRNFLAGVDHFFIYDYNDHHAYENITQLLRPFAPLITITHPPSRDQFLELVGKPADNLTVFKTPHETLIWHCFLTYGETTKWLIPMDVDEFLEAKHLDSLHDASIESEHIPFMHRFLREVEENVPAQIGRWDTVLTRGVIEPPPLSKVTLHEKYPIACGTKDMANSVADFNDLWTSKTAVQPRFLDYDRYRELGKFFVHGVRYQIVRNATEVKKELFFGGRHENYTMPFSSTETKWSIVHYWSRSFGDYLRQGERDRLNMDDKRTVKELLLREDLCREYKQSHVSKSSERRCSMVKELLEKMDGFDEIQKKYRDAATGALQQPHNQEKLREYKQKGGSAWPKPLS